MKQFFILLLCLPLFTLISCEEEPVGSCYESDINNVIAAQSVVYGNVGDYIKIPFTYIIRNTCGDFETIEEYKGSTIDVTEIDVVVNYNGCSCVDREFLYDSEITFVADYPGEYFIKFRDSYGDAIWSKIVVQ